MWYNLGIIYNLVTYTNIDIGVYRHWRSKSLMSFGTFIIHWPWRIVFIFTQYYIIVDRKIDLEEAVSLFTQYYKIIDPAKSLRNTDLEEAFNWSRVPVVRRLAEFLPHNLLQTKLGFTKPLERYFQGIT